MTAMPIPQHLQALAGANRIRLARAALRHDIADGVTTAASVIEDTPEFALTMTVYDLLMAQHRFGPMRAQRLLVTAQVREGKTLGSLTDRQRRVLGDLLNWGVARGTEPR